MSAAITTAVHGAGGYGKTSIAEELSLDDAIRARFPGGIYWLQFSMSQHVNERSQSGDFRSVESAIAEMLARQSYDLADVNSFKLHTIGGLLEALPQSPLLIIADDIWNDGQSHWLGNLPDHASALITTRNKSLSQRLGRSFEIDRLSPEASYLLLTDGLLQLTSAQVTRLERITEGFRGWPLLLRTANGNLKQRYQAGSVVFDIALSDTEEFLSDAAITDWDVTGTDDTLALEKRRRLVGYCLEAGLDALLDPIEKALLLSLAVFPEDTDISFSNIALYWSFASQKIAGIQSVSAQWTKSRLQLFEDLSFFREYNVREQTCRLHDEVLAYFRTRQCSPHDLEPSDQVSRHKVMVQALASRCIGGWETLPSDFRYGWTHLLFHLFYAGNKQEAERLLTDFHWLKRCMTSIGVATLKAIFKAFHQTLSPEGQIISNIIQ